MLRAMEPPAKRMRILQSIGVDEVDESNPEYIKGKQQNSEWLKNKWDAIYAKYGAMPDMMSDEVDMRGNGSIVVDRGHMRKLDKEYRNRLGRRRTVMPADDDTQLVDDMFANDKEMGVDDEQDSEYDERDELAPSQSPEPVLRKSDNTLPDENTGNQQMFPITPSNFQTGVSVPNTPTNAALQATLAASANPTANLIQLVQFPETPAGQQARRAFEAQTAQAVQQAVASIFSSLLSNAPSLQPQQLNLLQAPETPITPVIETSEIAPATLLSLYRPSPPALADLPARSSPVSVAQGERRKRRSFASGIHIKTKRHDSTRQDIPLVLENHISQDVEVPSGESSDNVGTLKQNQCPREDPLEHSREPNKRTQKYVFTAEDDQYIIESRIIHKRTWVEIINSRPQWKNWHKSAFWAHWSKKLKERAAAMEKSGELQEYRIQIDHAQPGPQGASHMNEKQELQPQSSPVAAQHLPTPSSLGHDDQEWSGDAPDFEAAEDLIASGGHFDDDEKDLLSLCGDSGPMCDVQEDSLHGDTDEVLDDAREIPETPLNLTQESSIQAILQGTVTRENTADIAIGPSTKQDDAPQKAKAKAKPGMGHSAAVSHATKAQDATFVSTLHTCPLCKQTFPTAAILNTHTAQPHPREIHVRASSTLPALNATANDDNDELQAPTTPICIKHEPLDDDGPPTNFLLSSPTQVFKTPVAAAATATAASTAAPSSGAKSTGKLSRSAYNQVKRSWARKGAASTPVAKKRKRQSAVEVSRKRFWDDVENGGSEDELAM